MADNDNDNEENETAQAEVDFEDLDDSVKEQLMNHPEVRRYVEYEETSIPQIASMLGNLEEGEKETFDLLVSGIAERRGRITEQTVSKVLTGLVEEYNDVAGGL
ncbi:hypothetical protein [Methanohalobium sp.]|uniref:hypothetical protein n=1 Tax=Methanohalobium sp. TaxID=2837493 RepID=UPI0025E70665|nr:hypothetical protein [Methanohalobium sp.]